MVTVALPPDHAIVMDAVRVVTSGFPLRKKVGASVPLPELLERKIQSALAPASHPQVPAVRVMARGYLPPVGSTSCVVGDTVYEHPGFKRKSARGFAGTVTACSPGLYPAADTRSVNASARRSSIRYSPFESVNANFPALTLPPRTSRRAPAIG